MLTLAGARYAEAADGRSAAGLSKSLAIEESRSGPASPHLLPLLDRLAGAQFDKGALADAAASRQRALRIALHTYGDSPNTAHAMVALADVEILRHRYSQSEALLIAALPTLEAANGADTPAMARPMASLARIALARGALLDAKYWADRANAVISRYPAASTTEPLRVIGAVDAAEDHFDEGERVLRAALARDRRAHGASSLQAARSLAQLANLLLRAQRFDKALPTIEEAIAIDQQRLGRAHPLIADDFADLGLIYAGLSRDDAACAALYYALDLLDRDPGRETPRVGYIELQLAPVLRRLGDKDAADAAFDDAKHILHAAADGEKKREREL